MTTTAIYDAFAVLVEAFANTQSPPLEVAYPGIHFNPPDSSVWLELRPFFNDGENYGLSDEGPTVDQGFFRVLVNVQPGGSFMTGLLTAELVVEAFDKGTIFGGARAYRKPSVGGPLWENEVGIIPVTVWWSASS